MAVDLWLGSSQSRAADNKGELTATCQTFNLFLSAGTLWQGLRWLTLLLTAYSYVRLRSWLAVDQLVSIYRKVRTLHCLPLKHRALAN